MKEKVKAWIEKNRLLQCGDNVLAACSGGPDSLALVHILSELRSEYNMSLSVAHVNHMLRGQESDLDAQFVAEFCQKLQLPLFLEKINVPQFIAETGRSTEDAARLLRYRFLRLTAGQMGGAKIATGHHRDDQAETVLLHLLRGAGSEGLRGMLPQNSDIIRPFLAVSRSEIEEYCRNVGLHPRLDSSNLDTKYLRNQIRLNLLPELQRQYNPLIKEALCRTAEVIGAEHDFVKETVAKVWTQVVTEETETLRIQVRSFARLHIAQQREIFRRIIEKKQGSLTGISFHHVENLIKLTVSGQVGTQLQLPGQLVVKRGYYHLEFGTGPELTASRIEPPGVRFKIPGVTRIVELGMIVRADVTDVSPDRSVFLQNMAVFDYDTVEFPVFVRTRCEGDRFQPIGLNGSKKLKDIFIDAKVPRSERDTVPIFCDTRGIIWAGGYRQAERNRISDITKKFLQLTFFGDQEEQHG